MQRKYGGEKPHLGKQQKRNVRLDLQVCRYNEMSLCPSGVLFWPVLEASKVPKFKLGMKPNCATFQIEQYFHVILFIMLYKVVLPFKSE